MKEESRVSAKIRVLLPVLLAIALLIGTAGAQDRNLVHQGNHWDRPGYFGLMVGMVGPGRLHTDTITYETESGFTFGAKLDFRLSGGTYWGFSADIHRLHIRDTGQYLFDVSLNLRHAIYSPSSMVAFRPGIGVGYGYLAQFREYNSSGYLLLKGGVEVLFFGGEHTAYVLELGMVGSPWGSNSDLSFRLSPLMLARAGLLF
jgi:hypothetical protein